MNSYGNYRTEKSSSDEDPDGSQLVFKLLGNREKPVAKPAHIVIKNVHVELWLRAVSMGPGKRKGLFETLVHLGVDIRCQRMPPRVVDRQEMGVSKVIDIPIEGWKGGRGPGFLQPGKGLKRRQDFMDHQILKRLGELCGVEQALQLPDLLVTGKGTLRDGIAELATNPVGIHTALYPGGIPEAKDSIGVSGAQQNGCPMEGPSPDRASEYGHIGIDYVQLSWDLAVYQNELDVLRRLAVDELVELRLG